MLDASPEALVYIASARADLARVEPVVAALRQRGAHVYFDPAATHGRGDYVHTSQQALSQASALLVFTSQAAARSPWVEAETRAFQSLMARGGKRTVILVRLDDTPLPVALATAPALDGASMAPTALADTVVHALGGTSPAGAASAAVMPEVAAPAAALVYVASARADLARVEPVVAALRQQGAQVYFDPAATHGSGNYVRESQQALSRASALLVFTSQAAARSPWVEAETRAYQSLIARGGKRTLIPVRLDDTPLPVALMNYHTLNGATAPATLAETIANTLESVSSAAPSASSAAHDRQERDGAAPWDSTTRGGVLDEATNEPTIASSDSAASKGVPEWPEVVLPPYPVVVPPPAPTPAPAESAPAAPAPAEPVVASSRERTTGAPPPQPAPEPGAAPTPQEQVTFTAYHPREMQAAQWQPLVVYLSLDTPATLAMVSAAAAERLAGKRDQFRSTRSERSAALLRGAKLRIVPSMQGFQFNPSYLDITWQEDVQQHEFRMRAVSATPGQAVNGVVQIYQGFLLRGEIPLSVFVGKAPTRLDSPDAYAQSIARAYRRVFASYSHKDMPVVESCETVARTMGDQYLRDVNLLQAGQEWDPRLIQAINEADIFQLFWSKRAASSPFVEREWRHALQLLPLRENFIRPVFWTRTLYPTPPELNALHFQPMSLSSLGWGWLRTTLYQMRNG